MSAAGKYVAMAAQTFEERERHRAMTVEALKRINISQAFRSELEAEFKRIIPNERGAEEAEEQKSRKGKKSSSGGSIGGGTNGSGGGDMAHGEESDKSPEEKDEDLAAPEIIAMLFFQAEQGIGVAQRFSMAAQNVPVAAETLIFNSDSGVAQIHEPFVGAPESPSSLRGDFLPLLEQHAVSIGARELHVHVRAELSAAFQNEFGYEPQGGVAMRDGTSMQRMSKNLYQFMPPKNDMP